MPLPAGLTQTRVFVRLWPCLAPQRLALAAQRTVSWRPGSKRGIVGFFTDPTYFPRRSTGRQRRRRSAATARRVRPWRHRCAGFFCRPRSSRGGAEAAGNGLVADNPSKPRACDPNRHIPRPRERLAAGLAPQAISRLPRHPDELGRRPHRPGLRRRADEFGLANGSPPIDAALDRNGCEGGDAGTEGARRLAHPRA